MFVNIQIKSKNQNSLKRFLKLLFKLSNNKKLNLNSVLKCFNKKSQEKVFTILRSPHVNKTSQEQFSYELRSNQLSLDSLQFFKFLIAIKKSEKITGFDVKSVIKFVTNVTSSKKETFKKINFKKSKIKLHNVEKINKLSSKKYLKLLDIHGNLVLTFCLNSSVGRAKD